MKTLTTLTLALLACSLIPCSNLPADDFALGWSGTASKSRTQLNRAALRQVDRAMNNNTNAAPRRVPQGTNSYAPARPQTSNRPPQSNAAQSNPNQNQWRDRLVEAGIGALNRIGRRPIRGTTLQLNRTYPPMSYGMQRPRGPAYPTQSYRQPVMVQPMMQPVPQPMYSHPQSGFPSSVTQYHYQWHY